MRTNSLVFHLFALAVLTYSTSGEGPTFETCDTYVCPPTATCVDDNGFVSCLCPKGKTGINCTHDDPCLPKLDCPKGHLCFGTCEPNIFCQGATGFAHCRGCVVGWEGNDCLTDIDECKRYTDPPICQNHGTCTNTVGDFICACAAGWTGKECTCKKGTQCDVSDIVEATTPKDGHVHDKSSKDDERGAAPSTSYSFTILSLALAIFAYLTTEFNR